MDIFAINGVGNFSEFLTPPSPPYRQFFSTIRRQFWQIFDPFPPPNCWRRLWTDPKWPGLKGIIICFEMEECGLWSWQKLGPFLINKGGQKLKISKSVKN